MYFKQTSSPLLIKTISVHIILIVGFFPMSDTHGHRLHLPDFVDLLAVALQQGTAVK